MKIYSSSGYQSPLFINSNPVITGVPTLDLTNTSDLTLWLTKYSGTYTCGTNWSVLDYTRKAIPVSSNVAPFYGARWTGSEWVTTEADGITEITSTIGMACHPTTKNEVALTPSRDMSDAAWTPTNGSITAGDVVLIDGTTVADKNTFTASAGNATLILDAHISASGVHSGGIHIERKTGTGNIEVTIDGGLTWVDVTTQVASDSGWHLCQTTLPTVTDPEFGVRLVTSGDAVYLDWAQLDDGYARVSVHPIVGGATVTQPAFHVADATNASKLIKGQIASGVASTTTLTPPTNPVSPDPPSDSGNYYILGAGLTETPSGYDGYFNDLITMNTGVSNGDSVDIIAELFSERLYFYKQLNIYGLDESLNKITSAPASLPKISQGTNDAVLPYTDTVGWLQGSVIETASSTKSAIELRDQGSGAPKNKTFKYCTILSPSGPGVKTVSIGPGCENIIFDSCVFDADRLYVFFVASGFEINNSTIEGKQITYTDSSFSSTDDIISISNNSITSINPGATGTGFLFAQTSEIEVIGNNILFDTADSSVVTFYRVVDFYSSNDFKYNWNTTTINARFAQTEAFRLYSTHVSGTGEFKNNTVTISNEYIVTPNVIEISADTLDISGNTLNIGETSITRVVAVYEQSAQVTSNEITNNTINIQSSIGTAIGWGAAADNQYLDGLICNNNIIYGKIHFTGDTTDTTIGTHGILAKDQKDCTIRGNIVDGAAYGIVLKSYGGGSGLTFTSGDISYNFIKNSSTGGLHPKGAMGAKFYHNSLVSSMTGVNNSLCLLTANDAIASTSNTTLENNIFAFLNKTTNNSYFYDFGAATDIVGLTSDYNAFINVSGNPNCFNVAGVSTYTFETWVALGHDTHSYYIEKSGDIYNVYLGSNPSSIAYSLSYCPISTNGQLVNSSDNPLIDTGLIIAGINDGGESDYLGYSIKNIPNIGASQALGYSNKQGYIIAHAQLLPDDYSIVGGKLIENGEDALYIKSGYNDASSNDGTNTLEYNNSVVGLTKIASYWGHETDKKQLSAGGSSSAAGNYDGAFGSGAITAGEAHNGILTKLIFGYNIKTTQAKMEAETT